MHVESGNSVDQCGTTPDGRSAPAGSTTCGFGSGKPLTPSKPSAVNAARAVPCGHRNKATQAAWHSVSGPLWVTTTPCAGRCQRRAASCARTYAGVYSPLACAVVSTPSW